MLGPEIINALERWDYQWETNSSNLEDLKDRQFKSVNIFNKSTGENIYAYIKDFGCQGTIDDDLMEECFIQEYDSETLELLGI